MSDAARSQPLETASFELEKVAVPLGVEVKGIDLSQELDDATIAALAQAHAEHEVLVFRDQKVSTDKFMAFGRRFGTLTVHPFSPSDDEQNELIVFRNDENTPPYLTDIWHSDETFREAPPMGTMLHGQIVPKVGGDTIYASMTAAFEGLSDRMKDFVLGLEAIHDFKPFRLLFGDDPKSRENLRHFEDMYPPAVHPVVREHPITGRLSLFVNPQFTIRIKGMEEDESRSLLDHLFRQAWVPEYQYRHKWEPGTIVFWDNRSTQHYAVHDYFPNKRFMERVTIKGDRPVGPTLGDVSGLRSNKNPFVAMRAGGNAGGHAPKRQHERERG